MQNYEKCKSMFGTEGDGRGEGNKLVTHKYDIEKDNYDN